MSADGVQTPRQRLLEAATRLFCRDGINATGVDAIITEAGTAKTTLYKLFGSKTKLVHAVLKKEGEHFRNWFLDAIDRGGGSAESKLLRVFSVLKRWFAEEDFYGCPFINAIGEHDKNDKQLRAITLHHKKLILAHIGAIGQDYGAADPAALAHQMGLLIDGAIVAAMVTRDPHVADTAMIAAEALLAKHAPARKPARSARRLEPA